MRRRPQSRPPSRPQQRAGPAHGTIVETTIERLGARGDGVANLYEGPLYVPFTLPGERVRARIGAPRGEGWVGTLESVLTATHARAAAPCRHFTDCGGCALQHLSIEAQADFKRAQVVAALSRRGFADPPVAPPIVSPPGSRRRVVVAARRTARGVMVGFHAAASDRIVAVEECPVADPAIAALLPPLADCLAACLAPGETADVAISRLGGALDVLIDADAAPELAAREALARFAAAQDVARLSWRTDGTAPEPIAQRRPVEVDFAGVVAAPPPGGFLQATAAGERAIRDAVVAALPASGAIADLFAGCGTLSLPLAARGFAVRAVERDPVALGALGAAARRAMLAVATEARDLERRPLAGDELAGLVAVIIDPPRAGARAQAAALAASTVPLVIAVSCDPATFARDARLLVDGGYRLESVQPIDQFLWSPHVELVAVFRRAAATP